MPRKVTLSPAEDRSRQVLNMAMRLLDRNAGDLGDVLGLSRQAGQQRQTGGARLRIEDIETIAEAWSLPIDLFRMEALDAGSWILNNMSEQVLSGLPWNNGPMAETDQMVFLAGA